MTARVVAGLVVAALIGWLAALMLGEYDFTGTLPFLAGPLLGFVIAEAAVAIGRARTVPVAVFCAAATAGSLLWAGLRESDFGVAPIRPLVWVSMALGAVCAYLRVVGLPKRAS